MENDNQQSKRKFFELGIKFGLLATVGTVVAAKAFGDEKETLKANDDSVSIGINSKNSSVKILENDNSANNTGTLGTDAASYLVGNVTDVSDAVMEELMGYFHPSTGTYDMNDVASWIGDSAVVSCFIDNNIT